MFARRFMVPLLAVLAVVAGVLPAAARVHLPHSPHFHHGGPSAKGVARFVRFLHARGGVDRVALRDVDNDGDLDVLASPRDGTVVLWRNAGHGRFALTTLRLKTTHFSRRGPHFARAHHGDDGSVWGVDRYDAAIDGAPSDISRIVPIAIVRVAALDHVRPVSVRRSSGRAPPLVA